MFRNYIQTPEFKGRGAGRAPDGPVAFEVDDVKAILSWEGEAERDTRVGTMATRPVTVTGLIPVHPTAAFMVHVPTETAHNPDARTVAPGAPYAGESEFVTENRTARLQKIGTHVPVTDEVFEDDENAELYLNARLGDALRLRFDDSVLLGSGTGDVRGFLNTPGIQGMSLGETETVDDAILRAIARLQVKGLAVADGIVMHPAVALAMESRKSTSGQHIRRPFTPPIIPTPFIDPDTILVGAFSTQAAIALRRDVTVTVSESHGTNFLSGRKAVRADVRAALKVYRPAAFIEITGEFPVLDAAALSAVIDPVEPEEPEED